MSYQIIIRDVEIPNPNPIGLDEPFDYKDVEIDVNYFKEDEDFEFEIIDIENYLPHEIEAINKKVNLKSTEKYIISEVKRIDNENELNSIIDLLD